MRLRASTGVTTSTLSPSPVDARAQCAQVWARKSGTLIGRDQAMMTLLRAGWAGAAAGAPRFAPTIAPPDRMLVGRGSGVAG